MTDELRLTAGWLPITVQPGVWAVPITITDDSGDPLNASGAWTGAIWESTTTQRPPVASISIDTSGAPSGQIIVEFDATLDLLIPRGASSWEGVWQITWDSTPFLRGPIKVVRWAA